MKKITTCFISIISLISISAFAENICPKVNPANTLTTYTSPCTASGNANGFNNPNQTSVNLSFENLSASIERIQLNYYTQCTNSSHQRLPNLVTEEITLTIGQKINKTLHTDCDHDNTKKYWTEAYPLNLYSGIYFSGNNDLKFKVVKN